MLRPASSLLGCALLVAGSTLAVPSIAATSGANGTHDPSRMVESNGKFWVFSTGGGSKSSPDGLVWTAGPRLFPNGYPSWVKTAVPNDQGIWAPDVIFYNKQYYLFYSLANDTCAVGVMTSPTLDDSLPAFKWTDHGMVVSSNNTATYCTIDPAPVVDADNNLWVVWGSGYSHSATDDTIFVTRLDNTTGLASSTDNAKPGHALEKGHIEAGYMHFHAGYYYLFWNSGGCCDGASSSYLIHIARSQSITGPYTGTKNFYGSNGSIHGPGHIGIYSDCGVERFTYHYYPDTGGSVLGENELSWGADGWPVVGAPSTTPLKPCGASMPGGGGTAGTGGVGAGGFSPVGAGGGLGGFSGGAGAENGTFAGSDPGNTGGVATEVAGSGGVTNVAGTTSTNAAGTLGNLTSGTATSGDSSSCSVSLPASSKRSGLEGWLFAVVAGILARARRTAVSDAKACGADR